MEFEFTEKEMQLVRDVRQFIAKQSTPALLKEGHESDHIYGGPESRKFIKKFAENGWLTPSWPKEYGGLDTGETARFIIRNEMAYEGVPWHFAGADYVGPTILRFGNEKSKEYLLPIAKGEIEFALGYTEPGAGSDLMGLEMVAEDKGDYFLVNGQKTFSTQAHVADYHWLAARTDPQAPRHKGISIFIVDLKSQGIDIRPMISIAGVRTNEVYYDNVKVPKENLFGKKNLGFRYIMSALDFERMFPYLHYKRFFESLVDYIRNTKINGKKLSKDPIIRQKIAEIEIALEVVKLLYYQLAYLLDSGKIPGYQSSMQKVFFSDLAQKMAKVALEITGLFGLTKMEDKRMTLDGMAEFYYRWSIVETIYGGTSEIQKNIIAQRGVGLPRN